MNVLSILVIVFLVGNALYGMKRGLIKTVFSIFSMITALLLTALISPIVTKQLQSNEKVITYFADKVSAVLPFESGDGRDVQGEAGKKPEQQGEGTKSVQEKFLESLPLPESLRKSLLENNSSAYYDALGVSTFREYLCNYFACMVVSALSFVVTFLVVFVLLKILCFSLDLISKLPLLNQANHLLGLAAGAVNALLVIWVCCIVLTAFGGTEAGRNLMKLVNESGFLSFLYNNNLLLGKVTDLSKLLP
ncbi:MAG: CvpA family protein [Lachnospiraceae bacterium]|nr:CvpA family protein [Lachnospiraceae bacterium]